MSLPRSFLEEIKIRIAVSDIVGRKVKLTRRGREFVGLSPFKSERTPSFTVNDEKQFYHCFATGKHGTIFDFLMETEGLSFIEAVETLAGQASLTMPARDPQSAQREEKRTELIDVTTKSAIWFTSQLMGAAGREALAYVDKRGVSDSLSATFGLGYAPKDRQALMSHLKTQGFSEEMIVQSGMAIKPDDGGAAYDRFRNRLMFPINDARGRVIAFGGRALEASAPAKYLNSPETPLFHKGHVLYNFDKARQPAYDTKSVLVVEGYMDVIGLARGGFHHTVAPLGTAITEEQIGLLWRLAAEPVLCLDGDIAGLRAAYRVIDRALPLLKPGHSLRFAVLPAGKDPDDIVREGGKEAMAAIIDKSNALVGMLWDRELAAAPWDTPERRAALTDRLRQAIRQIAHADVRKFYGEEIKRRLDGLFQETNAGYNKLNFSGNSARRGARVGRSRLKDLERSGVGSSAEARRSALTSGARLMPPREAMIVLAMIRHPATLTPHLEQFERFDMTANMLDALRFAIIDVLSHENTLDSAALKSHLIGVGHGDLITRLEQFLEARMLTFVREDSEPDDVRLGWLDALELQHKFITLAAEKHEAEKDLGTDTTQENFERLMAIENQLAALETQPV